MTPPNLPSLPGLTWSRHKKPGFSTRVASHVSGREVRLALMSYPLYEFEASYSGLSSASSPPAAQAGLGPSSLQSLMGFFMQLLGQAGVFLYTDPDDNTVAAQNVGVGDGVTQSFVMGRTLGGFNEPVSCVTAVDNVYLNGVNQGAGGIGWVFTSPNMLAFATAPGAGVAITADFTFAFQCRFLDDQLDFEEFMSSLWKLDSLKFRSIKANASTAGAVIPTWYTAYNIGSTAPYGFADFSTQGGGNHYLWNGATCSSGAAWLTAAGGTYANSSGKYITNASGLLASVAANTLPFDYSPTSVGTCLGLLLEGASTNLLTNSQVFGTVAGGFSSQWVGGAFGTTSITSVSIVAPDGTSTATEAIFGANSGSGSAAGYSIASGGAGTFTFSIWLYGTAAQTFNLEFDDIGSNQSGALHLTLTGSWQRYSVTLTVSSNATMYARVGTRANWGESVGTATSPVYMWGAQIEALSFASSYIPTTSAPASRAADSLYLPWTLTMFAARVKATMTAEVDNGRLLGAGSGGLLYQSAGPNATSNNGSASLSTAVNAWATQNILLLGGSPSGRVLSANGNTAATDSNALMGSAPSHIYLGAESGGSNASAGHFTQVGLWNVAPTGAQATALSGMS